MTTATRQALGRLAFAAALALVGLVLRPTAEVVGVAFLVAAVVIGVMGLLGLARDLSRSE